MKMIRFRLRALMESKSFRERRRITYQEITKATGIGPTTLSSIAARPGYVTNTDVLDKLCTFFDCSISDIVEHVSDDDPFNRLVRNRV